MPQPKAAHGVAVWEAIVIPGRMGRLAEALSELRSLRNDDPTDIETALELAQALILSNEFVYVN